MAGGMSLEALRKELAAASAQVAQAAASAVDPWDEPSDDGEEEGQGGLDLAADSSSDDEQVRALGRGGLSCVRKELTGLFAGRSCRRTPRRRAVGTPAKESARPPASLAMVLMKRLIGWSRYLRRGGADGRCRRRLQ